MGTLYEGSKNAVEVCMGIKPGEHVLIITDKSTYEIGNAIRQVAEKISSNNTKLLVLEDYGKRPMLDVPEEIETIVPWANVTFYAASSVEGEVTMRLKLRKIAIQYARHAHMPEVTKQIMEDGMCVDYNEVSKLSHKIYNIVKNAKIARVICPNGTEVDIKFNPNWKWKISDGIFREKGDWGNLPTGEVFTVPMVVNGKLSCVMLGDYFSKKYGILNNPINFEIENSRVKLERITGGNIDLIKELGKHLRTDENSCRVGEFALPTNFFLIEKPLIGNLLQDEKARVHLAFGDPYSEITGANWKSKTHVDGLVDKSNVWIDNRKIIENGRYII